MRFSPLIFVKYFEILRWKEPEKNSVLISSLAVHLAKVGASGDED